MTTEQKGLKYDAGNRCPWKDCNQIGTHPQLDKNKEPWATLCQVHHDELASVISAEPFSAKRMLSVWIKAMGGAKAAAARM